MNVKRYAMAATLALGFASGAAHAVLIDHFNDGFVDFPGISATGSGNTASGTQSGSNILGGTRDVNLLMTQGAGTTIVTIPTGNTVLDINNGTTERSEVSVTWDDMVATNLEALGATGLFLGLPSAIDNVMTVIFDITSSAGTLSKSTNFADGSSGNDFFIPFAGFGGYSVGDFSDVTSIVMTITSPGAPGTDNLGLDTQIDFVETRDTPVPEPTSLFLFGAGLFGFAARRKYLAK